MKQHSSTWNLYTDGIAQPIKKNKTIILTENRYCLTLNILNIYFSFPRGPTNFLGL